MRTVILLSDCDLDDSSGRAADFRTRAELLETRGWNVVVASVSEPYVLRFPLSVGRCLWTAVRHEADVVNSVNNPFHLHVIALVLSMLLRLPWVAELRDPLVNNPDRDPQSLVSRFVAVTEWLTVHYADFVVWGDGIQLPDDYFTETYPDLPVSKFEKLPFRGFRVDEFDGVEAVEYDAFTITYAGSFYDGWIEPLAFFEGLARYVEQYSDDELNVQFYGGWRSRYDETLRNLELESVVEHHSFVPKEQVVPVLKGSDVLLYIGGTDPRNELNVPSKLYDYAGAERPILALVDPEFRVASLVDDLRLGVVVDPREPAAISEALHRFRTGDVPSPDREAVRETFDRSRKVDRLAAIYSSLDRTAADGQSTAPADG